MGLTFRVRRVATATSTDLELIAATTGRAIIVCSLVLDQVEDANNQTAVFRTNNVSGNIIFRTTEMHPSRSPLVLPFTEHGWFETNAGHALFFDLTGGTTPLWKITMSYYLR